VHFVARFPDDPLARFAARVAMPGSDHRLVIDVDGRPAVGAIDYRHASLAV
jgi:hypothetical protein